MAREVPFISTRNSPSTIIDQKRPRIILGCLISVICALSVIPAYFAWAHAELEPGKKTDSDLFQLLASVPMQLLGIFTALWPVVNLLRPDRGAQIQSWTSAIISLCFTITAIPLYLYVSTTWSGMSLLAGSFVQFLLQLKLNREIPISKIHRD